MPRYQWWDEKVYEVTQFILKRLTDPDLLKDVPPLASPTDAEVHRGRQLFAEKGCAVCHVIEGVTPQTDFGPDLSAEGMSAGPYLVEVKSAHKLPVQLHFIKSGSDHFDMGESIVPRSMIAYIQAKITNPGSITPETHMPQFHMSQSDLDDLTTALLSMTGSISMDTGKDRLALYRAPADFHPDAEV